MENVTFLIVFIIFLFKQGSSDNVSIKITDDQGKTLDQIHRKHGDLLALNCSISGLKRETRVEIKWIRNGWLLSASDTENGTWFIRTNLNVTHQDGGFYECLVLVYNGGKKGEEKKLGVDVNVEGKPLVITSKSGTKKWFTSSPVIVFESSGRNYNFKCHAFGWPLPSFKWFVNGKEISGTSTQYQLFPQPNGLLLGITGISKEKGGTYTCQASNSHGKDSYDVDVIVKQEVKNKPEIKAVQSYVLARHGQPNITLTCIGTAMKQVDTYVEWLYNGNTELEEDNKNNPRLLFKREYYDQYSEFPKVKMSLVIRNVTQHDSGNYTCIAYVNDAVVQDIISLTVVKNGSKNNMPRTKKMLPLYAVIPIVISSVVVLAIVAVIGYRYKRKMKFEKPKIPEGPFKFGVFITYSSQDYGWVQANLLPFLKDNNIETCIHYRNFDVGVLLEQNIVNCVYKSRVVIAVLSRNYLRSKYCRSELDYAIHRGIEQPDTNPLVTLKIDNQIPKRQLPLAIRRKTFIDVTSDVEKDNWKERLLLHIKGKQDLNQNEEIEGNAVVDAADDGNEKEALMNHHQNGNLCRI